ncbi:MULTISPECIES: LacI family DNA-binding transcriptional regulator [Sphingomonadales]|uniref:Catabolite control protein A n=1 Tax=Edaphosphingomonas haloaromaticamans TaxID=653954 RepID=A0A1S1H8W2_9SPHN|nr:MULTISPECIES: LacI family DNA-binding transcriptional regulator [Sphingomonas]AGH50146.1 LacI-family transcriptional regulator [Sphingomonas sp. MM-1]OHT18505.1 Catabolite control protein A [Sphingomonas haloaromaticamans]
MANKVSRRQGGAPTIADVAREAGVSPMTVSRVINGEKNVREATREAVNAAIAALNYAPNPAARSLAGADQIRIGLLYSNPSSAYLSEFLVGGLDQASRRNVQLVVEKCDLDRHEVEVAQRLVASGIDGIILPPPLCDSQAVLKVLADAGTPAVAVATGRVADNVSAVSIDDFEAAFAMTRHIVSLGHRRVGFIIGNPNQTASGRRLEGYRAALEAAGLPLADELITQGLFTYRSGLDAAERLLELAEPPSAIFASNDDMAAATVAVAHRRGLDVPGDLTVCGFDDTALATTIWPELTTIHQPITDMSRAAVELLVDEIKRRRGGEGEKHRRMLLDFTLVRRQSDAAPRRRPTFSMA